MRHSLPNNSRILAALVGIGLLATPAFAQQPATLAPPTPTTVAARKELAEIRARLIAIEKQDKEVPGLAADVRTALNEERAKLRDALRRFAAECAPVTVRVPIEPRLAALLQRPRSRPAVLNGPAALGEIASNFLSMVYDEIGHRGSKVEITIDAPLSMFRFSGAAWEVEEAKALIAEAIPPYLARIEELDDARTREFAEAQAHANRESAEQLRSSTVNLDWAGGKLGDLIAKVKTQVPCNVLLAAPSLADAKIPPLSVSFMAPEVFFEMLETLPGQDGNEFFVTVVSQATIDPDSKTSAKNGGSLSAITITPVVREEAPVSREVFDVRGWSKPEAASQLVDSIGFAMDAAGFADKVKIRLHAPSNLLFVQGPREAVELVRKIIEATRTK